LVIVAWVARFGHAMPRLSRALAFSVALAVAPAATRADDGEATLGGFLCARPIPPACANDEAFLSPRAIAQCQRDVEHFIAATADYRDCLQRQIAAAMRRANDVIDRFRCRSQLIKPCAAAKGP
jgi:hypothetical protein